MQSEQWLVAPSEGRVRGQRRARQDLVHRIRRNDVSNSLVTSTPPHGIWNVLYAHKPLTDSIGHVETFLAHTSNDVWPQRIQITRNNPKTLLVTTMALLVTITPKDY